MQLQSLTPNLMVKDVNQTLKFYTDILGFEVVQTVPEQGSFDWGMVKSGDVEIMFQKEASIISDYPTLQNSKPGGALSLYIHVESIQKWYAQLQTKTEIIKPLCQTFYGANEFAFTDPDGYILTYSEMNEAME